MTWVQNNRFLAILLAVVVLGVGGLGYGIYSAYGNYDEVSQRYQTQAAELRRLQKLTPYPEEANRRRYEEVRQQYAGAVRNLQARLADESLTPETISATDFQNRLRDVVAGVTTLARQNNVTLPESFYLGFDPYRVAVPPAEAAPLLAMQLKSCEQVARTLISRRVERVMTFRRAALREEGGTQLMPTPTTSAPVPATGRRGDDDNPAISPVTFYPLQVDFHAPPGVLRDVLDDLLKAQPLYVIRALRVKNERDKGPGRGAAAIGTGGDEVNSTAAPAPTGPARAGTIEPPLPDRPTLRYIVGTERLDVQMRLELARFGAP